MSDMAWYWSKPDLAGWHKQWHHIHTATNVRNPPQFKTITKVIIVLNPGFLIREHHNLRITMANEELGVIENDRMHFRRKMKMTIDNGSAPRKSERNRSVKEIRRETQRTTKNKSLWKQRARRKRYTPRAACNSLLNYIETTTATSGFQLLVQ
jgi:hypothetical protein